MEVEKPEHAEIGVKNGGEKRGSGTRGRSNLRIKTVKNVSDNYHFSLSIDDKKNVNIMVGRRGSGKTALFNKIKFCPARTEDGGGIDLKLSEEADYDVDDIFVDECVGELPNRVSFTEEDVRRAYIS